MKLQNEGCSNPSLRQNLAEFFVFARILVHTLISSEAELPFRFSRFANKTISSESLEDETGMATVFPGFHCVSPWANVSTRPSTSSGQALRRWGLLTHTFNQTQNAWLSAQAATQSCTIQSSRHEPENCFGHTPW
jgi:hypothetical protein